MTFDPKCFELAAHFLPNGSEKDKTSLAQDIQRAVDDFFYEVEGVDEDGSVEFMEWKRPERALR
jgi:hypothetical protein